MKVEQGWITAVGRSTSTSCSAVPPSVPPLRHADRGVTTRSSRELILAAARRVNLERGPGRATFAAIAAEAGVSRVTLYKWFPTKEDLAEAVEAHETELFIAGLAEQVAAHRTRRARFDAALRYLVTYIDEEPAWSKAVAADPAFPLESLRRSLLPYSALVADVLGDALRAVPAVRKGVVTNHEATEAILRLAYSHYLMPHDAVDELLSTIRGLLGVPAAGRVRLHVTEQ